MNPSPTPFAPAKVNIIFSYFGQCPERVGSIICTTFVEPMVDKQQYRITLYSVPFPYAKR